MTGAEMARAMGLDETFTPLADADRATIKHLFRVMDANLPLRRSTRAMRGNARRRALLREIQLAGLLLTIDTRMAIVARPRVWLGKAELLEQYEP